MLCCHYEWLPQMEPLYFSINLQNTIKQDIGKNSLLYYSMHKNKSVCENKERNIIENIL